MKIVTLDIETAPATAFVWGIHEQTIGHHQIITPVRMLCFAAKWLDRKKVHYRSEHHDGTDVMLAELWQMLDEADAVVHYNGASFDIPHINREFITHGYGPPSPFAQIDLFRTVRSRFKFLSNKLDSVAQSLDLGAKVAHEGFNLWVRCLDGDDLAWARMRKYNIGDVRLTEDLYLELRPWIAAHPAVDLDPHSCPPCGSKRLQKRGLGRTKQATYQRYQCLDCGSFSRSTRKLEGTPLRSVV